MCKFRKKYSIELLRKVTHALLDKEGSLQVRTSQGNRSRVVSIRFEFRDPNSYKDDFAIEPQEILHYFESKFIHKVMAFCIFF